jgi:uncharacterized repeat protein (TIGR04076 family)
MTLVKITVIKRTLNPEIAEKYRTGGTELCELFEEGQVFMTEEGFPYGPPKNFCPFAWNDIYKFFMALKQGGSFSADMQDEKKVIACCTDGVRPVIFELERVDEA